MSPVISTMATKKDKLSYIESLSPEEILKLIPHDVMNKLVLKAGAVQAYLGNVSDGRIVNSAHAATSNHPSSNAVETSLTETGKAMRPLNAFIAFRSYYKTMFRGIQQKEVSSYLTLLWAEDSFRNKWALVAKVYSFVRDEVGKSKATLGDFLAVACPIMGIIEPADYLRLLGWVQTQDEDGNSMISQDKTIAQAIVTSLEDQSYPNTELELLVDCIRVGYLPSHGDALTAKLASKSNTIMTPNCGSSNDEAAGASKVFDAVFADPVGAAADLLGNCGDNEILGDGIEVLTMEQDAQRSKAAMTSFMSEPFNETSPAGASMVMNLLRSPEYTPAINIHNLPISKTYDMRDLASVEEFVKDNNQGYHDSLFWRYDNDALQ